MAQSQVIAKVSSITGEAFARDGAGKLRRLKAGDAIREGESVVASDGSQVNLALADGREMTVRPGEVARLDAEVGAPVKPDAADSAVADHGKGGLQKIAKALTSGNSLDALLDEDAPAAGAGQGGNEGHTFVEFLRVVETVDPLSYQFATSRGVPLESIEAGPLVAATAVPVLAVSDVTVEEGSTAVFTVSLDKATESAVTLTLTPEIKVGDTAEASDIGGVTKVSYTDGTGEHVIAANPDGTYTIPAGVQTLSVSVGTTNDAVYEGNETFTLKAEGTVSGATLTAAEGKGTLTDNGSGPDGDDPGTTPDNDLPVLAVSDVTVEEGSTAVFTVSLDKATESAVTLTLTPEIKVGDTAEASDIGGVTKVSYTDGTGEHVIAANPDGTYTIPAGVQTLSVSVGTTNDAVYEGNETFTLKAEGTVSGATLTAAEGKGTLTDNGSGPDGDDPGTTPDNDLPVLAVSDVTVEEGSTAVFTVSLDKATESAVTLTLTPEIKVGDTAEASDIGGVTKVSYTDGTGEHVIAANPDGTYTIPAGVQTLSVSVGTTNDAVYEGNETFTLKAEGTVSGATLTAAEGKGTLTDNGSGPDGDDPGTTPDNDLPVLAVSDVTVEEGSTAVFTVSLDKATESAVTLTLTPEIKVGDTAEASDIGGVTKVSYTDGTGEHVIAANPDGTYTIPAGVQTLSVSVGTTNDAVYEGNETFTLKAEGTVSGVTLTAAEGKGTLTDNGSGPDGDDPGTTPDNDLPVLAVSDVTVEEGSTAVFTVSLDKATESAVTLTLTPEIKVGDTAEASDIGGVTKVSYTDGTGEHVIAANPDGTYTIPAGVQTLSVSVGTTNDAVYEGNETFTLKAEGTVSGATLTAAEGKGTLTDNGSGPDGDDPGTTPDNDLPVLAVSDVTVEEGSTAVFTVSLDKATESAVTLTLTPEIKVGDTAEASDIGGVTKVSYTDGTGEHVIAANPDGTYTIPAGVQTLSVSVGTTNDAVYEGNETFTLKAEGTVSGATLTAAEGKGTLTDNGSGPDGDDPGTTPDNDLPVLAVSDVTVEEGSTAVFTVSLDKATESAVTLTLTPEIKVGDTAEASDIGGVTKVSYTDGTGEHVIAANPDGTYTIPAGVQTLSVSVGTTNDAVYEGNETFTLKAEGTVSGATLTAAEGKGTLTDNGSGPDGDDPGTTPDNDLPVLAVSDVTVEEGSTAVFTVSLDKATESAVTLTLTPEIKVGDTAEASDIGGVTKVSYTDGTGEHVIAANPDGTYTIPAGVQTLSVSVGTTNDAVYEGNETFTLKAEGTVSGATLTAAEGKGTLTDNGSGPDGDDPGTTPDNDLPVLAVSDVTVEEGSTAVFTVSLDKATESAVTLTLTPEIKVGDTAEASDIGGVTKVSYTDGTGEHVIAANPDGTYTIPAGVQTLSVSVGTTNDAVYEGNETFTLKAEGTVSGATLTAAEGKGTLTDNGSGPDGDDPGTTPDNDLPVLAVSDVTVEEGSTAVFTVSLDKATESAVTLTLTPEIKVGDTAEASDIGGVTKVSYTDGTGEHVIAANPDGTYTIPAGVQTLSVSVGTTNDAVYEGNETFTLKAEGTVSGATLTAAEGKGTLTDNGSGPDGDDPGTTPDNDLPVLAVSDVTVEEGSTAVFTVSLDKATESAVTLTLTPEIKVGDTAEASDIGGVTKVSYTDGTGEHVIAANPDGTYTIPAGVQTLSVSVGTTNDAVYEGNETFTLKAEGTVSGATLTAAEGKGTLTDNGSGPDGDDPGTTPDNDLPVLAVSDVTVEEGSTAVFTVSLDKATESAVTLTLTPEIKVGDTAEASDIGGVTKVSYTDGTGEHVIAANPDGTYTIPAGVQTLSVSVGTTNDAVYEGNETFTLKAEGTVSGVTLTAAEGKGTLTDNGSGPDGDDPGTTPDNDLPVLAVSDVTVEEGSTAVFTVSLDKATESAVTLTLTPEIKVGDTAEASDIGGVTKVSYTDGTGEHVIAANPDGTYTIPAGVQTLSVSVGTTNDAVYEGNETFTLKAEGTVSGATLTAAEGKGTLTDNGSGPDGDDPGTTPDNDLPVLAVSDVTVEEGSTAVFTVSLDKATESAVTLTLTPEIKVGDTAEASDIGGVTKVSYTDGTGEHVIAANPDGTYTIPAGVQTLSVSVGTTNDAVYEGNETFTLKAEGTVSGVTLTAAEGKGTLTDNGSGPDGDDPGTTPDNDLPVLAVSDVTVEEGSTAVFTVSLDKATESAVTLTLTPEIKVGDTAEASDIGGVTKVSYTDGTGEHVIAANPDGTYTIPAGVQTLSVSVGTTNDAVYEGNETFTLKAEGTVSGATLTAAEGKGTLTDNGSGPDGDDPGTTPDNDLPVLAVSDVTVEEGSTAVFTVSLDKATESAVTLTLTPEIKVGDTAEASDIGGVTKVSYTDGTGEHVIAANPDGTYTIPAGVQTLSVSVGTTNDAVYEGNETFTLKAEGTVSGVTLTAAEGKGTLTDNGSGPDGDDPGTTPDNDLPVLAVSDVTVEEGSTAVFTVSLDKATESAVTLTLTPEIKVGDTAEASDIGGVTKVSYTDGTGEHVIAANPDGTYTIPAGVQTLSVSVGTTNDAVYEGNETFTLKAEGTVSGATLTAAEGKGTLTDNGSGPDGDDPGTTPDNDLPVLAVSDVTVEEGSTAVFTVSLDKATESAVTLTLTPEIKVGDTAEASDIGGVTKVSYTDGTGEHVIAANPDGTYTIPAGVQTLSVSVGTTNDAVYEGNETFTLKAEGTVSGATLTAAEGKGTLTDNGSGPDGDDPGTTPDNDLPVLAVSDVTVEEGSTAVFTVSLDKATESAVTLTLTPEIKVGDTAEASDIGGVTKVSYTDGTGEHVIAANPDGTYTIPAGVQTLSVSVGTTNDAVYEGNETFTLKAEGTVSGVTLTAAEGKGTLTDNGSGPDGDDPGTTPDNDLPVLAVSDVTVEEGSTAVFTVSLDKATESAVTLTLTPEIKVGDTAEASDIGGVTKVSYTDGTGEHVIAANPDGTYTIPAGVQTLSVSVGTTNDAVYEGNETFTLKAEGTVSGATLTAAEGKGTLTDNGSGPDGDDPGTTPDNDLPVLAVSDVTVEEGSTAVFTVSLDKATESAVTLTLTPEIKVGDTAEASDIGGVTKVSYTDGTGEHVIAANPDGTYTIPAGVQTLSVSVGTTNDAVYEGNETFTLKAEGTVSGATLTAAEGKGTLTDNGSGPDGDDPGTTPDNDLPVLAVSDVTVEEGSTAVFTVSLDKATESAVTLTLTPEIKVGDTAEASDIGGVTKVSYTDGTGEHVIAANPDGTYTIPAGVQTLSVSVGTTNDAVYEGNETFTLKAEGTVSGATLTAAEGKGTLTDNGSGPDGDDPGTTPDNDLPVLAVSDVTVEEGSTAVFTVSLDKATESAVTLTLTPEIKVGDTAEASDIGGVTKVSYTDGTGEHVIAANPDGTYTIPAGVQTLSVSVGTTNDAVYEGNETFTLKAEGTVSGATLTAAEGKGTLTDNGSGPDGDDPGTTPDNDLPVLAVSDVTVEEGSTAVFTVSLDKATESAVTLTLTPEIKVGDTAEASDIGGVTKVSYTDGTGEHVIAANPDGTYTIPAGVQTLSVSVGTTNDAVYEGNETFTLKAEGTVSGATLTAAEGKGTLTDNGSGPDGDDPGTTPDNDLPVLAVSDVLVHEGDTLHFILNTGTASSTDSVVTFTVGGASSDTVEADDYSLPITVFIGGVPVAVTHVSGGTYSFTMPSGATSADVAINSNPDGSLEGVEQLAVSATLSGEVNGIPFNSSAGATGYISDANMAPSGQDSTISLNEDASYALKASDFGFVDSDGGNLLSILVGPTSAGTLYLNGSAVTGPVTVTLAELNSGLLTFEPVANANGSQYATFNFQVKDDQGTINGGQDIDQTANTITFNVVPVNDAPTTTPVTLTAIAEDSGARVITQAQLLGNAADVEGNTLTASNLTITSGNGTLVNNGNGTWTYTPALNDDTNVSFSYTITDNGTTNGVSDPKSVAGSATLDITPVNDAPTTTPVTLTAIAEDSGARVITQAQLLGNAADVEGNTLTASNLTITSGNGTLVNNGNGTWTYTPALNDDTNVSFSYTITDNGTTNGVSDPKSVAGSATLDITPVNDAPTTTPVTLTAIAEDSGARVITQAQLLGNAADVEGNTLTASNLTITSGNGTLVNNGNGTWTYTPALNDDTNVSFSYTITDNGTTNGVSDPKSVAGSATLDITPVNDAPTTTPVTLTAIAEDSGARVITQAQLLGNAADVEGNTLTASNLTITSGNGTLVNNGNGTWTYTPALNDDTNVSFSYTITDNGTTNGVSDPKSVAGSATLDITPVNDAPTTTPVTLTAIAEDSGARVITQAQLLGNAADVEGNTLTASNLTITSGNGTLVNNGNGTWTYTPALNDDTNVSFSYTITDNGTTNGVSDPKSVAGSATLDITPVNDAPTTTPVTLTAIAEDSGARVITQAQLLGNAADVEGNTLTASNLTITSGNGTLVNNGNGTWTYTPALNDDTNVSFSYTITDNGTTNGVSDPKSVAGSATLDITPVNDAPTTTPVTLTAIAEDSGARVITQAQLLGNAADVEGNTLTASNLTITSGNGTLVNNGNGTWTYTPALNDDTNVSFSYTITDNGTTNGVSDPKSVAGSATLDITPVNDAPTTTPVTLTAIAEDSGARVITQAQLLGNAADVEGNTLTASNLTITSGNGTLVNNGNGTWTYTPALNDDTNVSFSYTITDNGTTNGVSDPKSVAGSATLDITPVNDAPTTTPVTLTAIAEDSGARVITQAQLLGNAADVEGNTLTASNLTITSGNGTLVNNGNGTWTYTPALNDDTNVSFSYTITDNGTTNGVSDPKSVAGSATLDITPVNDAPTTTPVTLTAIAEDSGARVITQAQLLGNAADVEGNTLTASNLTITSGNGTLVNNGNGTWTYTPALNDDTNVSFSYTITDNGTTNGVSDPKSVAGSATLDITPVNDAPTTTPVTLTAIAEDSGARVITQAQLLGNAADVEGNTLTASNLTITSGNGTLVNNGNGTWTYTPALNDDTNVSFSYTITDNGTTNGVSDPKSVAGSATLDITPVDDPIGVTGIGVATGDETVYEKNLSAGTSPDAAALTQTGTFAIQAIDGVSSLNVGGTILSLAQLQTAATFPVVVDTPYGALTLTGYSGNTQGGTVNYSYLLQTNVDNDTQAGATTSGYVESIAVTVTDTDGDTAASSVKINIVDDAPVTHDASNNIYVGVDLINVNDLKAGWQNSTYSSGTGTTGNTDADAYVDTLTWGTAQNGGSRSGYTLVDNTAYTSAAGTVVQQGTLIKLADFTHNNFPVSGGSLTGTDLIMTMDVVINGISTPVSFTVHLTHTETPNTGTADQNRDIITLPTQSVSVNINGQPYVVKLDGFRDSSGNVVNTIYTNESASNVYGVYGSIVTTDALPSATGNVLHENGADASATNVVWDAVTSTYGSFVGNSDGSYTFVMNDATRNSLTAGQSLSITYGYTVTDNDGDASHSVLTINVGGYQNIEGSSAANTLTGTAANEMLMGYAGNDSLVGGAGNDVLVGGAGTDTLTGGTGVDVLKWNLGETGSDNVVGFGSAAGTDILDLRDLLVGESHAGTNAGNLANFLHFTYDSGTGNTTLSVHATGSATVNQTIILQGVDLGATGTNDATVIQNLLTNGKLIVD
ncbi:cadherin-like domain-containing protein [Quatrionicoccus australiensis]|uniref:cadherin-like domain-containing protein n=1 Tax=Quatrionicoccus australiensis TaxID=138118 RepID=UPI001CF8ECDA|nr:cadherin-like domain-containing protein [Quatrionicoccus australiensis]UCV16184.1 cadherin-like domain-containing protein [Quatrionicoccus australiensis]